LKILFDQGTPVPLRNHLSDHEIDTAFELGWSDLNNGELLDRAEMEGYDLMITTDQNLQYQQHLSSRSIAIVVLLTTSWPRIKMKISDVASAVDAITPGGYREVAI
jgi:hypothetical protein